MKKKQKKKTIVEKIITFFIAIFDLLRVLFKMIAWASVMIVAIENILPFIKTTWGGYAFATALIFGGIWWVVGDIWSNDDG